MVSWLEFSEKWSEGLFSGPKIDSWLANFVFFLIYFFIVFTSIVQVLKVSTTHRESGDRAVINTFHFCRICTPVSPSSFTPLPHLCHSNASLYHSVIWNSVTCYDFQDPVRIAGWHELLAGYPVAILHSWTIIWIRGGLSVQCNTAWIYGSAGRREIFRISGSSKAWNHVHSSDILGRFGAGINWAVLRALQYITWNKYSS